MKAFAVLAPKGRRHILSFPTDYEAEAVYEAMREDGTTVMRLHWSRSLQRYVTIPTCLRRSEAASASRRQEDELGN